MADLAPCPFCGGTPKLRTHRSGEDSMEAYVECPTCEVSTTYYEDAYAPAAIGAWNRRTPAPVSKTASLHSAGIAAAIEAVYATADGDARQIAEAVVAAYALATTTEGSDNG